MRICFFIFITSFLLCACGTQQKLPDATIQETRNVDVKFEKVFVHDTTYIEIPAQTAERTTRDSSSHLENDYAISDARINADGTLFHDLKTKPQKKPVLTEKQIERKDSIIYVEKQIKVPVLTEKTCIEWFPYLLGATILTLIIILRKLILR